MASLRLVGGLESSQIFAVDKLPWQIAKLRRFRQVKPNPESLFVAISLVEAALEQCPNAASKHRAKQPAAKRPCCLHFRRVNPTGGTTSVANAK